MSRFKKYIAIIQETNMNTQSDMYEKINTKDFKNNKNIDEETKNSILEEIDKINKERFMKQILNIKSNEWEDKGNSLYERNITSYFNYIINELDADKRKVNFILSREWIKFLSGAEIDPNYQEKHDINQDWFQSSLEDDFFGIYNEPISNQMQFIIIDKDGKKSFEIKENKSMKEITNFIFNQILNYIAKK